VTLVALCVTEVTAAAGRHRQPGRVRPGRLGGKQRKERRPAVNALTAMCRAEPGSAGAVQAVSVIRTGTVRIRPEHPCGTRKPLYWWLLTSRRWTPPRPINVYAIEHAKGLILFDTGQDRASVTDDTSFPGVSPGACMTASPASTSARTIPSRPASNNMTQARCRAGLARRYRAQPAALIFAPLPPSSTVGEVCCDHGIREQFRQ
jgi:hypothetical protein